MKKIARRTSRKLDSSRIDYSDTERFEHDSDDELAKAITLSMIENPIEIRKPDSSDEQYTNDELDFEPESPAFDPVLLSLPEPAEEKSDEFNEITNEHAINIMKRTKLLFKMCSPANLESIAHVKDYGHEYIDNCYF